MLATRAHPGPWKKGWEEFIAGLTLAAVSSAGRTRHMHSNLWEIETFE